MAGIGCYLKMPPVRVGYYTRWSDARRSLRKILSYHEKFVSCSRGVAVFLIQEPVMMDVIYLRHKLLAGFSLMKDVILARKT
jgi:hypothetical protein